MMFVVNGAAMTGSMEQKIQGPMRGGMCKSAEWSADNDWNSGGGWSSWNIYYDGWDEPLLSPRVARAFLDRHLQGVVRGHHPALAVEKERPLDVEKAIPCGPCLFHVWHAWPLI